jgi:chromosomal replication initiation ATPase DnaA
MPSPQLALDLAVEPDYRPSSFCVSEANAMALASLHRWPRWRHGHLLLTGPRSSGKTHMARIWAERADPLEIKASEISNALSQIQRGTSVLVEDIDRSVDEDGLFHLINRASGDAGVTFLATATGSVEDWGLQIEDLKSRLRAAETASLTEPDDALLRQVMEKLFRDRRTPLSEGVIEYLLLRMDRSIDFARALTAWLDREALARKGPVTRPLAREALSALSGS